MRRIDVTPNLVRLERLRFVNAYLVREDDGFTLVDTGVRGSAGALMRIARADLSGEIRRIVLTHGHGDHVGSLDALRAALGGDVEVLMGEADARIHAGERIVTGRLRGSWPKLSTTPDTRLRGGERISSLEAVASPGHSPGHMAFLDTRDRTLIGGDAFTTSFRLAVPSRLLQPFPLAAMATQDRDQAVESARRLETLNPRVLAVGHGPALGSPGPAMEAAVTRAQSSKATWGL